MSGQLPPPDMPPAAPQPRSMPGLLNLIQNETVMLERALAGYSTLTLVLRQVTQGVQEGERRRGLPILNYKATADGKTATDVCCDLKNIDPQYLPHVLSPMCNAHAVEMHQALVKIYNAAGEMLAQCEQALGMQPQPTQHPAVPPQGEEMPTMEGPYEDEAPLDDELEEDMHQQHPVPVQHRQAPSGAVPPVS